MLSTIATATAPAATRWVVKKIGLIGESEGLDQCRRREWANNSCDTWWYDQVGFWRLLYIFTICCWRCFYQVLLLRFHGEQVLRDGIWIKDRLLREQGLQDRQEERPGGSPVGERLCRWGGFLLRHLWQPQRRGRGELGMKRIEFSLPLKISNFSDRRAQFAPAAVSCATKTGSLLARRPRTQVRLWERRRK